MPLTPNALRLDAMTPPDGINNRQVDGTVASGIAHRLPGNRLLSLWAVPVTNDGVEWRAIDGWQQRCQRIGLPAQPWGEALQVPVQFDFSGIAAGFAVVLALVPHQAHTYELLAQLPGGLPPALALAVGAEAAVNRLRDAVDQALAAAAAPAPQPDADEVAAIEYAFENQDQGGGFGKALLRAGP